MTGPESKEVITVDWFHFKGDTAKAQLMDLHHRLVRHGYMREAQYVLVLLNEKQLAFTRCSRIINRVETLVGRVSPKITVIKEDGMRKAVLD